MYNNIVPLFSIGVGVYDGLKNLNLKNMENDFISAELKNNVENLSSVDGRILDKEIFSEIKKYCTDAVNNYSSEVLGWKPTLQLTNSWLNKTTTQNTHHRHEHKNSLISGVLYISKNNSPIRFYNPLEKNSRLSLMKKDEEIKQFHNFNSLVWDLVPTQYSVFIFPSWIEHSVLKQQSEDARYSVAFNTWFAPEQTIGELENFMGFWT